ncbi:D-glycero-beta-D-manno-heptose 1-phosphate adenylyltransferase [Cryobacterium sp.]|uniref:D-glycero-beta-D-manno-heptose 1-phosphate adenylyltransferase n=1 Tax=Cryobacterium sp. TaxID=1926290 RepID=UPI00261B524A|nr:D-glycero-beta-D-manno-heptose 1-phosphate adenylyltransferase [Cryobacterium sp.]MCU1445940.1 bifunctional heptose 7-phosphate kinase/heptose 1-phosphate adenyltransferase [Cryobacterium sp.]
MTNNAAHGPGAGPPNGTDAGGIGRTDAASGTESGQLRPELPADLRVAAPAVTVIGDLLLDVWWIGTSDRLCREAPAPVVDLTSRTLRPGGAANTAMNLAALGARVRVVGLVGEDEAGRVLCDTLRSAGIDVTGLIVHPAVTTTTKTRVVSGGQMLVRVDDRHRGPLPSDARRAVLTAAGRARVASAADVFADYGSGLFDDDGIRELAAQEPVAPLTVVDAHTPQRWAGLAPHIVAPNAAEAAGALGLAGSPGAHRPEFFIQHADELRASTGAQVVAVTLDVDGSVLLGPDGFVHRTRTSPAPEQNASGCGDTYVAVLTMGRCAGLPWAVSVGLAQAAADVVVRRPGTAVCSTADLVHALGGPSENVLEPAVLGARLRAERDAGRRIVFTNGCFDVLHRGHVASLRQARRLGDLLVVAINGDDSTRRLKGPGRPVNPAADRAALVGALSCVDYVVVFDTDTPIWLIEELRPDVYAKGGDYTADMLAEAAVVRSAGGEVRILDYVPTLSSTAIVNRILGSADLRRAAAVARR